MRYVVFLIDCCPGYLRHISYHFMQSHTSPGRIYFISRVIEGNFYQVSILVSLFRQFYCINLFLYAIPLPINIPCIQFQSFCLPCHSYDPCQYPLCRSMFHILQRLPFHHISSIIGGYGQFSHHGLVHRQSQPVSDGKKARMLP